MSWSSPGEAQDKVITGEEKETIRGKTYEISWGGKGEGEEELKIIIFFNFR